MLMSQSSQRTPYFPSFKHLVRLKFDLKNHKNIHTFQNNEYTVFFFFLREIYLLLYFCFQFDAFIYDTIKSYTMGLVLYLFVEAPFGNLLKPTIKKR